MKHFPSWILASLLSAGLFVTGIAHAQYDQAQLVRPAGADDLNSNLARLAANPRDVTALIGAGEAALALDDPRAATGFFARADAIESGNGRIKAGLGRVMVKLQNPVEALRLFDQAGRLGYPDTSFLSERGLARDMTGDQAGAQRDYQAALKLVPGDDETVRRYAASLGISGQIDASEKILQPLLYKSDRAAWRYRAFILAMNNRQVDAKKIADQTLPAQLAAAITPYMQKMPYLTAAQKAAAIHFGHFPTTIGTTIVAVAPQPAAPVQVAAATPAPASRSDRRTRRSNRRQDSKPVVVAQADTTRVVAAPSPPMPAPAPMPPAPTAPVTRGQSLAVVEPQVVQPAAAQATRPVQSVPARTPPTAIVQAVPNQPDAFTPASSSPAVQAQGQVSGATQPSVTPPSAEPGQVVQGPPATGFESVETGSSNPPIAPPTPSSAAQLNAITLAQASAAAPATVASTPALPATVAEPARAQIQPLPQEASSAPVVQQPSAEAARSLADIIRAIDVPEAERQPSVAAVDLAEIDRLRAARRAERQTAVDKAAKAAAAKAKAEADAAARKEAEQKKILAANPARSWLQIGVGASRSALPFTLRTMQKKYVDIAMQKAWFASWGRTNRLLVGPFANFKRAREMEQSLKAAGADVFAWQSDAGEVVERLDSQ